MATGFGIPNTPDGLGTTPEDIQVINAAEFPTAGVISGCEVEGTSTMTYKVRSGAVVVHLAPGRAVKVPVMEQTINTQPAPRQGSRTDIIYVKQNTQAVDGNVSAVVKIGETLPQGAVMLSKREIRPGVAATSAAPEAGNVVYSRPVGGSLGRLFHNYFADDVVREDGVFTRGVGEFYLPTDRNVDIKLSSTVMARRPGGGAYGPNDRGSIVYKVYVDNEFKFRREVEYGFIAETKDISRSLTFKAGRHRIHYTVQRKVNTLGWQVQGGGEWGYAGDQIVVMDQGVAIE